jgi:hypothetical protein
MMAIVRFSDDRLACGGRACAVAVAAGRDGWAWAWRCGCRGAWGGGGATGRCGGSGAGGLAGRGAAGAWGCDCCGAADPPGLCGAVSTDPHAGQRTPPWGTAPGTFRLTPHLGHLNTCMAVRPKFPKLIVVYAPGNRQ